MKTYNIGIPKVKRTFDYTLLVLSIILAVSLFGNVLTFDWSTIYYSSFHSIGLGTIVTTIINTPIISLMSRLIDKCFDNKARFTKLEKFLSKTY